MSVLVSSSAFLFNASIYVATWDLCASVVSMPVWRLVIPVMAAIVTLWNIFVIYKTENPEEQVLRHKLDDLMVRLSSTENRLRATEASVTAAPLGCHNEQAYLSLEAQA